MAQANPLYGTENFSTTLNVGGGINNSQTTGIVLTSVSGLNTNGGVLGLTWSSTLDSSTYEEIIYTGISSNELTGVTRGAAGTSGKAHNNGATVVAVVSSIHNNRLADKLRGVDEVLAQDPNGNEIIETSYVASAVNEITVTNAATGNKPTIAPTGGDTNITAKLLGKGSGGVEVQKLLPTVATLTDGANIATNAANGNYFTVTLGGNRTIDAPTNPTDGQIITYELKQDGTGSRTITWASGANAFSFGAGVAPTLSTTAAKVDLISFRYSTTVGKWLNLGSQLGF